MLKEIPYFIERKTENKVESKIPRNIIQTYKHNKIHPFVYNNIMEILKINEDFNYFLITDDIGIELIKKNFDQYTLDAFNKLNLGAAKGDFLRYVAIYVYGGVYLDMDSNITISLSSFIAPKIEHLFFLDGACNIQQWCFMSSPKNPVILKIINEMVKRIYNGERNIFLATGPVLTTDVIYNYINESNYYNTPKIKSKTDRYDIFIKNKFGNGIILNEDDTSLNFSNKFKFTMNNYNHSMLYNNEYNNDNRYIPTSNGMPTPNFYK